MLRLMMFGFIWLLVACSLPSQVQPTPTNLPTPTSIPIANPTPSAINGKISIGDRSIYMICLGTGSPTVILDAGYGGTSGAWTKVHLEAMKITRVCAYDRANLGSSDKAPVPRTIQDWTNDLDSLLKASGIPGPYILVGHSFAGHNVRLYTAQHPQQVAGVILVESSHPDQTDRMLAALPAPSAADSKDLVQLRRDLDTSVDPMTIPQDPEKVLYPASMEQVRTAGTFGDIPLIVISRAQTEIMTDSKAINDTLAQVWSEMQKDFLALSTRSTQIIAEHSGHMVPEQEPEVVVNAIEQMVQKVR
jgi:pimeloyl-ACP methyl ester carboxylesterase